MKILVVEASSANLLTLSRFVERLGGSVLRAECGEQAIEQFAREHPDLVLLDVSLPDIDGHVVAQHIRAMEKPDDWTPIIFLSAIGKDKEVEQAILAGGDDYLQKPVSETLLAAKLRAIQRIIQMRTSLLVLTRKLDTANYVLKRLSAIDGLTGIANRRLFDDTLTREWRRARRGSTGIALMMCDVDHFKRYNDHYGHQAGDDCLRRVATGIAGQFERAADVAARYGGEEFAVIMPETTLDGALYMAEKIIENIRSLNIPHIDSPHARVTLSIGIAACVPGADNPPDELILAADRALYCAKTEGRDRVCRADLFPAIAP